MPWLTGYAVFDWVAVWANPFWDVFFRFVTDLGSPTVYYIAVAPLFWVVDRRRAAALFLLVLIAGYLNNYAKLVLAAPRPDPALTRVLDLRPYQSGSNGFPSGHAQIAVAFWGYLASWVGRGWFTALAVLMIALISFSRLYLGVHFPLDVIGGLVLGAASLPLLRSFESWAANDLALPVAARLGLVAATLLMSMFGDAAVAIVSGSLVGFLAGASWLPQRRLAISSPTQRSAIVGAGLALQMALVSTFGLLSASPLALYVQTALLWVIALWLYPLALAAVWLKPSPVPVISGKENG
jgi:membrane-associated phospholipid phosphatase